MKIFLLIMTTLYFVNCFLTILHKFPTQKESLSKQLTENIKTNDDKTIYGISNTIVSLFIYIYLWCCMLFVNNFIFSIFTVLFMVWGIYDMTNAKKYIDNFPNDDFISITFDNKLYAIISLPFDFIFTIFMLYQLFIH